MIPPGRPALLQAHRRSENSMRVGVIGAGAFGTALSNLLASRGHSVKLWAYEAEVALAINERHENALYLPGISLAADLRATGDLAEAVDRAELVLLAVPSHVARAIVRQLAPLLPASIPIVTVAKGIENESLLTMTEV
ncbi:MAG TPA: hypothetical protein DFS52_20530, partial [Myxococcales bacterium]|nr:hypothetical protein [Myxococcales bacterium]